MLCKNLKLTPKNCTCALEGTIVYTIGTIFHDSFELVSVVHYSTLPTHHNPGVCFIFHSAFSIKEVKATNPILVNSQGQCYTEAMRPYHSSKYSYNNDISSSDSILGSNVSYRKGRHLGISPQIEIPPPLSQK